MRLVSPALGTIDLSASHDARLFDLAKVGLGLLGVVSELTLQCVPAHELIEHTFVTTAEVRNGGSCALTNRTYLVELRHE